MRALRRITTPAFAVALTGCSFPVDDFRSPSHNDAGLTTNGDAAKYPDDVVDTEIVDTEVVEEDAGSDVGEDADAAVDACTCVKKAGPQCKEWSPPGCGD